MRRWLIAIVVLSLSAVPAFGGGSSGKIVLDLWDVAYLGEGKAGYVHTIAREIEKDGEKVIQTTVELRLTVKRFTETIQLAMDTGSMETRQGKVVGVFMKQFQGREQQLQINGTVVGKQLQLVLNGKTPLKPAPWNDDVVGLYKQQLLPQERNLKPGDRFAYLSFEPSINLVLKTEVVAKGYRDVEVKGKSKKQKLLLIETIPEKIEYKQGPDTVKVQLPITLSWLDENLEPVKMEVEIPSLGPIVIYRSTKAQASRRAACPVDRHRHQSTGAAETSYSPAV